MRPFDVWHANKEDLYNGPIMDTFCIWLCTQIHRQFKGLPPIDKYWRICFSLRVYVFIWACVYVCRASLTMRIKVWNCRNCDPTMYIAYIRWIHYCMARSLSPKGRADNQILPASFPLLCNAIIGRSFLFLEKRQQIECIKYSTTKI